MRSHMMKRRTFIAQSAAACSLFGAISGGVASATAQNVFKPNEGSWRTFKVTTVATLPGQAPPVKAWIPIPAFAESDWMRPGSVSWEGNATAAEIVHDSKWDVAMLYAQWLKPSATASMTVVATVSTRDLAVDLSRPADPMPLTSAQYALYTSATRLLPTDGIVAETAKKIIGAASSDEQKAERIYEWVVVNVARNPKTRGCGLGDVSFMLETGDLSGKCADINGLYVALVRSAGIPARDLYGIRVAPSRFAYKSLGVSSSVITKAQHCRSEVYLTAYGWVPADPADVRKVMLEEPPGNLSSSDPKVNDARQTLFGAWEGNYVAYNDGHDISLPGSTGPDVGFLMYPQAEVEGARRDSLAPDDFVYTIAAEQIA
jgi:transglutaminase-like putative cysteine protease